ncbi:MAG: alkaline phosphatase D family protein [Bacteroidota bacterium]
MRYLFTIFSIIIICLCSCQNESTNQSPDLELFAQGIASGDPGKNQVLIWTRVSLQDTTQVAELNWEMALDADFTQTVKQGKTQAIPSNYHTTKVLVDGLEPGSYYFYRFEYNGSFSPTGRTKTLPEQADTVRLAIVNCSKYEGGYFNGFDAVANMEVIDAVLHLGDYIYENPSVYPSSYERAYKATGRRHKPEHEILSLSDYRTRFQQYREDSMLQKLHQRYPMINIWDDHETANDSWAGGAQGHQEDKEGKWETRKANALKAYFEWIPINKTADEPIYRSFDFADLVNVMMLDTRLCCRTEQASNPMELDSLFTSSSIVGKEQLDWIYKTSQTSIALWNLLGNQVLMSRRYAGPDSNYISYDQWTGYPKDRLDLLAYIAEHPEENFLIATGNVHSAYHFLLKDGANEKTGKLITQEFAPGSISSTNSDEKNSPEEVDAEAADLRAQNPHMPWFDITNHGFIIMEFTKNTAKADWYQVSTLYDTNYELIKAYSVEVLRN